MCTHTTCEKTELVWSFYIYISSCWKVQKLFYHLTESYC